MTIKDDIENYFINKENLYSQYNLSKLYDLNDLYYNHVNFALIEKEDKTLLFAWEYVISDWMSDEPLHFHWTDGGNVIRHNDLILLESYDPYDCKYNYYILDPTKEKIEADFSVEVWKKLYNHG